MNLKTLGVFCAGMDHFRALEAAAFAKRIEAWGYGALWFPEAVGRESLSTSAWLLANTTKLTIATGIANIYARDAQAVAAGKSTLNELSNGRFLLGLGVSHVPLVEGRNHRYGKPVETMRAYLKAMGEAAYSAAPPPERPKTVIAALGPKMLALAAELADGALPLHVTPEHTAQARTALGPGKLLCVEQAAILESDAGKARALARQFLTPYFGLPNYYNNWNRLGFTDADRENGGSDRLIDALIVWGDEKTIRARLDAHLQAGADHVCVHTIGGMKGAFPLPDEKLLALLAPGA